MKRRAFIKILSLSSAGILTSLLTYSILRRKHYVKTVLERRLPYLTISESDAVTFTNELTQHANTRLISLLESTALFGSFYAIIDHITPSTTRRLLEEHLARVYLLSTDFFRTSNKEHTRYIQLYDPHRVPCQNPFAEGLRL